MVWTSRIQLHCLHAYVNLRNISNYLCSDKFKRICRAIWHGNLLQNKITLFERVQLPKFTSVVLFIHFASFPPSGGGKLAVCNFIHIPNTIVHRKISDPSLIIPSVDCLATLRRWKHKRSNSFHLGRSVGYRHKETKQKPIPCIPKAFIWNPLNPSFDLQKNCISRLYSGSFAGLLQAQC
jgi:hypothetical protein